MVPHLERRSRGRAHPVVDFLFEYYRFRPSTLMAWSPGLGVTLEGNVVEFQNRRGFEPVSGGARVCAGTLAEARLSSTRWILNLLEATQARPAHLGCHGLHEWAMVYRSGDIRHRKTPLRLPPDGIAQVVESAPLTCTHYDAFRFFAPEALPRNRQALTAEDVHLREQPGCLHANMDLYRWAMKRHPWIPSDITAEAFLLANEIREVDMRASPYDLNDLGYAPIRIESESGREEYRRLQASFHARALPLRQRLIDAYRRLVQEATGS